MAKAISDLSDTLGGSRALVRNLRLASFCTLICELGEACAVNEYAKNDEEPTNAKRTPAWIHAEGNSAALDDNQHKYGFIKLMRPAVWPADGFY
ncbi:unnamed protein product [Gongylonema pulchrum]|uniref:Uncharacterized protein n=1 Tax=Gongylonema pulchrum TaxID=637853 RepID=A0A183DK01_9BILA|nr:unnamed protein product [Gongylonema pulchrum]